MNMLMISTVREFFRQRAGMFFVILGVLFGFLSSREHYSFAIFFLTDPYGMFYLLCVWFAYTLLCVHFVLRLWALPEYTFIYASRTWSFYKRLIRYGLMALGLLQPLIYYGIYMIFIASQDQVLHRVWPLFFFYVFLAMLIVSASDWRIRHPHVYASGNKKRTTRYLPRPVSWTYWTLEWLVRERGVTLLVCKMGAVGVVTGTILYYSTDHYDLRLPAIGMSLGYLMNIGISYELYRWEIDIWMWNRSLPTSLARRMVRIGLLHGVIILPETLLAARQQVLSLPELAQLYFLGISILLLFHTFLYKRKGLLEDMMQPVLFGFIVLTLLVLYKIPLAGIALLLLLFAGYRFPAWYRSN